MWLLTEIRVLPNGKSEERTGPHAKLKFEISPYDDGLMGLQVCRGEGLAPKPMWVRYLDLPKNLRIEMSNAAARKTAITLTVRVAREPSFRLICLMYEGVNAPLFMTKEAARK